MSNKDLYVTALNKAMALCASREYCTSDIRKKLEDWGLPATGAGKIIGLLIRDRFLDDRRYAEAFVKDRFRYNKWGRLKITAHLKAKRITQEIITSALNVIDDTEYRKVLSEIISSHRRSVKARNQYDLKGKLLRYGLSKGFESHYLYEILNEDE